MTRLCVFQGTFNPIHQAHIRVANYVLDKYDFDKIVFVPAFCPPHKEFGTENATHRLNLVRIATDDNPKFEVSDIEFVRGGKSYTYITIEQFYKIYKPTEKIYFLIGTDAFKNIKTWYKTDLLKKRVKFLVFIRENDFKPENYDILKNEGYDFEIQQLNFSDISSTQIRNIIKNRQSSIGLLSEKERNYIEEHGLYRN